MRVKNVNGKKVYDAPKRPRKGTKLHDLRSKSDDFLECREGHMWKKIGYFYWSGIKGQGICRKSECLRCGTLRDTFINPDGTVFFTNYDYPEGYVLRGEGRVSRAEAVLENIRRQHVYSG